MEVRLDVQNDLAPIIYAEIPGVWEKVLVNGSEQGRPVLWEILAFVPHAYVPDLNRLKGSVDFKMDVSESLKLAMRARPEVHHEETRT